MRAASDHTNAATQCTEGGCGWLGFAPRTTSGSRALHRCPGAGTTTIYTHTNVIRPFNVYGPGMQETDYRVLPNFASRVKAGDTLKVYGTGNQTRTFCYITDAMVGFLENSDDIAGVRFEFRWKF